MGFERSNSNKHKPNQTSSKANNEVDDAGDVNQILISRDPTTNNQSSSDAAYISWLVDHPSALESFEQLMKSANGKKMVVFLDYDGTLSPIVDDPDRAFMSDDMREAVCQVAKHFPTAIISGRSRNKVKEFVKLSNVYYAGSHGMDIMAPRSLSKSSDGKNHPTTLDKHENQVLFQPAKKFLPAIQEMLVVLEEKIRKIQGARVEDNIFCASVHFRQVREEDYEILEEKVKSTLENYPEFCLCDGKKVIKSRGQGYPIIVSSTPKDTSAFYSLQDPSQVLTFLRRLARWQRNSCSSPSQIWGIENLNGL
ncbi:hypothetical protein ACFE04_010654 [Oxalis oulophora]